MFYISDGTSIVGVKGAVVITTAIMTLLVPITFYLLRSIGLYQLGKKNGVRNAYLAFIPFVWYYVLFKLIRETNIFGFRFGKHAVLFTVICGFSSAIPFLSSVFDIISIVGYYVQGGELTYYLLNGNIVTGGDFINPFNVKALNIILTVLDYIASVASIVAIVLEVFAYVNLFRKFWPERYILGAVLSVFKLFPIMVFIIRKKKAVNFVEYMRSRYYYNNPYGENNYSQQQRVERPENPFGEFSEKQDKPEDPFDEFNDKR